jgi:nitrogen fixation NifU-like protein
MLGGVSAYPVRIKCAVLPWHTLQAALAQKEGAVSTE